MKKKLLLTLSIVGIAGMLVACETNPSSTVPASDSSSTSTATEVDYKIGLGTAIELEATEGVVTLVHVYAAAVVFDAADKVINSYIDEMQLPLTYTAATSTDEAKLEFTSTRTQVSEAGDKLVLSKKELGKKYGMYGSSYGSELAEWYEQAAAFEDWSEGKTITELKAGIDTTTGKPNSASGLLTGCTITIDQSVATIENALENAKTSKYVLGEEAPLAGVGMSTIAIAKNYAGTDWTVEINMAGTAVVVGEPNVVALTEVDAYQVPIAVADGHLDAAATATVNAGTKVVESKRQLHDRYGMYQPEGNAGSTSQLAEWYDQAAAYEEFVIGKNATEIAALAGTDGKPTDADLLEGCTIAIASFDTVVSESLAHYKGITIENAPAAE